MRPVLKSPSPHPETFAANPANTNSYWGQHYPISLAIFATLPSVGLAQPFCRFPYSVTGLLPLYLVNLVPSTPKYTLKALWRSPLRASVLCGLRPGFGLIIPFPNAKVTTFCRPVSHGALPVPGSHSIHFPTNTFSGNPLASILAASWEERGRLDFGVERNGGKLQFCSFGEKEQCLVDKINVLCRSHLTFVKRYHTHTRGV